MTSESFASTALPLLRELAPQVLGAVARRHEDFAAAEAVQEALTAAAMQWPVEGIPTNPRGWLLQVAARRLTDRVRSEMARRRREDTAASQLSADETFVPPLDRDIGVEQDDTLVLLFMCCHPALTPPSAIALRAVGGLATAEIANAFLVPEGRWRSGSAGPSKASRPPRFRSACPRRGARRAMAKSQDCSRSCCSRWDEGLIAEGIALASDALSTGSIGSYQLQAAIAAVHDEAARAEDTDWPQIFALHGLLEWISDNPMVALNHAIAAAMVHGPVVGLELLKALDAEARMGGHYRLDAVRAHLLEMAGDHERAIVHYRAAAERTTSAPERNYLSTKSARLTAEQQPMPPAPQPKQPMN